MLSALAAPLGVLVALSVSVERIIEILKGMLPKFWLFLPNQDPTSEYRRCALIHLLSAAIGTGISFSTHIDILKLINPALVYPVLSSILAGLLCSAGSAFWNHLLDIVKAVKVRQESEARSDLDRSNKLTGSVKETTVIA